MKIIEIENIGINSIVRSSKNQKILLIGYAFFEKKLLKGEEFVDFFKDILNLKNFTIKLKDLNGLFSIIIENETNILLATDAVRSLPLFYTINNEQIKISSANRIKLIFLILQNFRYCQK